MKRRVLLAACIVVIVATLIVHARTRAADVPVDRDGHMEMTVRASPAPGDAARGIAILTAARAVMRAHANVADAERDGFKKFLPNVPLPYEHYTSSGNAIRAEFGVFDPAAPTSLIYKRTPAGLTIVGVMYTASNRSDVATLDAKVPLSLGTWHRHVDFCWPPGHEWDDPRFGMTGSIDDRATCEAAGGRFIPRVFGWMVHVWPNESTPAKMWAVDAGGEMAHHASEGMIANQTVLPIPREKLPVADVAPGNAIRGAAIFAGNCASCHGAGGANGPDAPRLRGSGLTAGQVAFMVHNPRGVDSASTMPDLGLRDQDVADVAAYVATLATR